MNAELTHLCNRLLNVLHELDQHVAPADLTGKRLVDQAHQHTKEIARLAERGLEGRPPAPQITTVSRP